MWDGFNKRKFPRVNLECQILIHSEDQNTPLHATTQNVGAGGVCVLLDRSLERFSHCRVKLDLDGKPVEGDGKVVWIVPTRDLKSSRKRYDTGIEFVGLDDAQRDSILAFLQERLKNEV